MLCACGGLTTFRTMSLPYRTSPRRVAEEHPIQKATHRIKKQTMDTRPRKVPGLSLASLKRQLHVAETAAHGYDFDSDSLPIMTSLQSPTTRTLHAIAQNRAHFLALEREIEVAKAEERALQSLVDESEALKAQPLLGAFKGRVENEMEKVNTERARDELKRSDEPVSATVLLSGGVRSAGIKTTLTRDGEMVITTPDASSKPVSLLPDERPTRFVPDEDDAIATGIAEQIVFTLPRDAAGTVLEVVPSTLLTAADRRRAEEGAQSHGQSPNTSAAGLTSTRGIDPFGSALRPRDMSRSPLFIQKRNVEPKTLTEALGWGDGSSEDYYRPVAKNKSATAHGVEGEDKGASRHSKCPIIATTPARENRSSFLGSSGASANSSSHRYSALFASQQSQQQSSADIAADANFMGTVSEKPKTLKELLAEQRSLEERAQDSRDLYDKQIAKFSTWQERRVDLLTQFTQLDGKK